MPRQRPPSKRPRAPSGTAEEARVIRAPAALWRLCEGAVAAGLAPSVSEYVRRAVREQLVRDAVDAE